MSDRRHDYQAWYEKVAGYWIHRREQEEKLNEMEIHEYINWLKSASIRELRECITLKLSTWKRWLLLHELAHRILPKVLPQYRIVEEEQENRY